MGLGAMAAIAAEIGPHLAPGATVLELGCGAGAASAEMLARIWRALKPGGVFYASFKTGEAEGRDTLDRYYNYPSPDWLRENYAQAGEWISLEIESGEVRGFDNEWAGMLFLVARKCP